MIELTVAIDDRAVIARLEALPDHLRLRLREAIETETARMLALAIAAEPVRTGALRQLTQSFVDADADKVRGRVRVLGGAAAHAKAGALEYGAHGTAKVAAHQMMLGHLWGEIVEQRAVLVEAYTRQVNIKEFRFMHGAFDAVRAEAVAAIKAAVDAEISRAHSV